jgi:hypothetical protein
MNADTIANKVQTVIYSHSTDELNKLLDSVNINEVYSWPGLLTFTILDIALQNTTSKKHKDFALEAERIIRNRGGKTYEEFVLSKQRSGIPLHPPATPKSRPNGIASLKRYRRSRRSRRLRKN